MPNNLLPVLGKRLAYCQADSALNVNSLCQKDTKLHADSTQSLFKSTNSALRLSALSFGMKPNTASTCLVCFARRHDSMQSGIVLRRPAPQILQSRQSRCSQCSPECVEDVDYVESRHPCWRPPWKVFLAVRPSSSWSSFRFLHALTPESFRHRLSIALAGLRVSALRHGLDVSRHVVLTGWYSSSIGWRGSCSDGCNNTGIVCSSTSVRYRGGYERLFRHTAGCKSKARVPDPIHCAET